MSADLIKLANGLETHEDLGAAWVAYQAAKDHWKKIESAFLEAATQFMRDNPGAVQIAEDRILVLSPGKKTTVRDKESLLEALLNATGGDLKQVSELMSSQPFKYGDDTRHYLGDQWDDHFEVTITDKPAERKPKVINTKFS